MKARDIIPIYDACEVIVTAMHEQPSHKSVKTKAKEGASESDSEMPQGKRTRRPKALEKKSAPMFVAAIRVCLSFLRVDYTSA